MYGQRHGALGSYAGAFDYSHEERPPDRIQQLVAELDEQERELWKQLRRKRDFEGRAVEKRAQLVALRNKRRPVAAAYTEAKASIDHLSFEVDFTLRQEDEMRHDISVLRESNQILEGNFQSRRMGSGLDVEKHHASIAQLRAHLDLLYQDKHGLHLREKVLFEKHHAAEQDRNLLLGSLREDRQGIADVRAQRLSLCEERNNLEQTMTAIVQGSQFPGLNEVENGLGRDDPEPPGGGDWLRGRDGGVRVQPVSDTPELFGAPDEPSKHTEAPHHWTSFTPAPVGEVFGPESGITEWGHRLREYKAREGDSLW